MFSLTIAQALTKDLRLLINEFIGKAPAFEKDAELAAEIESKLTALEYSLDLPIGKRHRR